MQMYCKMRYKRSGYKNIYEMKYVAHFFIFILNVKLPFLLNVFVGDKSDIKIRNKNVQTTSCCKNA